MATVAQTKLMTAEEFMAADLGEGTFELVRGEVVEVPPRDAGTWTWFVEMPSLSSRRTADSRVWATRSRTTPPC